MNENTHRFTLNQDGKDITILLWKLSALCTHHMHTLFYGTDYKHGNLFHPDLSKSAYEEQKLHLLTLMMDVAQEIGATKEDVLAAWDEATQVREEAKRYAMGNEEKYWK